MYQNKPFHGQRYLRTEAGAVYQSIFYGGRLRCDPAGYANFAAGDTTMNVAAEQILTELVQEAQS
jgi:hypothetical protein